MSYDITTKRLNARSRQKEANQESIEDIKRAQFLQRLNAAPFEVTNWEADFIGSTLRRLSDQEDGFQQIIFSAKQRESIDKMRKIYEHRL